MGAAISVLSRYGYAVVFATVFAEQIGLPFPSEPFLLAAGALGDSAGLNLGIVLLLAGVASLIGDTVWYWIGRAGGARALGWLCRLSLEPDSCVRRTELAFGKYGARALVMAKFVPGLSTIAPPLAGVVGIPLGQFMVFSAIGAVIWAGAYMAVGWVFSSQLELAVGYMEQLGSWAMALLVAAIGVYVGGKYISRRRFLRRLRIARMSPEELKAKMDGGQDVVVVDVRDRIDFEAEPTIIPGALHMAIDELDDRHHEIPRDREIVLYCTCPNEASSARVALILRGRGVERVRPLTGGFRAWRDRGYPMTKATLAPKAAPRTSLTPATSGGVYA
jgi:membrane protein DedA with SNARE-associated domain/rhodanese-related sulfurtransferase